MYENVRRSADRPIRRNRPLAIALAACIALTAALVALIWWACRYQVTYRNYLSDLSNSTVYAYDSDQLELLMLPVEPEDNAA